MQILKYTLIIISLFCFVRCSGGKKDNIDSAKPNVTLNSPTASTSVKPGDVLNVEALLSDNVMLDSYIVKIISTGVGVKQTKNIEDYSFDSLIDLDAYGNSLPIIEGEEKADLNFKILISERARCGNYIFSLSVLDQSDNETKLSVEFKISCL